jgi:branched-chain amino acid aminotransferase
MSQLAKTDWIWKDGTFVRWEDCQVHVLAHSMQFGSSIFEGIRCYATPRGPAIFRLREHMVRFVNSAKVYRMDLAYSVDELMQANRELVVKNGLDACYLRPMIIRGYGAAGMVPLESPIEVYLPCWPWGTYLGEGALENGVDVCVSTWQRVAPNTIPAMAKVAGNYLGGQLIKMEALANGFAEAIALDTGGRVSEGSGQNVFLVRNGALYTPPVDGSLLPGITRDAVISLAKDAGIPVHVEAIAREALYMADEIFFSGTAAEITPVRSVDRIKIGAGKPGPITQRLQADFENITHGKSPDPHGWLTYARD